MPITTKHVQKTIYIPETIFDFLKEHQQDLFKEQALKISLNALIAKILRTYAVNEKHRQVQQDADGVLVSLTPQVAEWLYYQLRGLIDAQSGAKRVMLDEWYAEFRRVVEPVIFEEVE